MVVTVDDGFESELRVDEVTVVIREWTDEWDELEVVGVAGMTRSSGSAIHKLDN
jgi:hypothetical protein